MSSELSIELGISQERQEELNERVRRLLANNPSIENFLLAVDKEQDLCSLEKITIAATATLWMLVYTKNKIKVSHRKVPMTSKS